MKLTSITYGLLFLFSTGIVSGQNDGFLNEKAPSENPYAVNYESSLRNIILGGGALSLGAYFVSDIDPFTEQELLSLDVRSINGLDRGAAYRNNINSGIWSDRLRNGTYFLPAILLLSKNMRHEFQDILLISAQTYLLNAGATTLFKGGFSRARPLTYNQEYALEERTAVSGKLSFFSGHTSSTAVMSFMTAKFFHDFYPDSPLRPYIWGAAGLTTATVAWLRYDAGKHWTSDVIVGAGVGALLGILVPQSYKKRQFKNISYQLTGSNSGLGLVLTF
jgi:membrane-associated phospholipid phosphatase